MTIYSQISVRTEFRHDLLHRLTYLLADTSSIPTKHNISSQQPGNKTIIPTFFPGLLHVQIPQNDHGTLIDESEGSEVARMLAGSFYDKLGLFSEAGTSQVSVKR